MNDIKNVEINIVRPGTVVLDRESEADEQAMDHLRGSSITYRIAVGAQQGRKVFTLQTLPATDERVGVETVDGFSLHAGVSARANQRQKLERLCRYITRPAIASSRLLLTAAGSDSWEAG